VLGNDPSGNPYTGHAYYVPAPQYGWDTYDPAGTLTAKGMDYSPAQGKYYAIDYCTDGTNIADCLISIADANVDF
jgi:hypothetical protein